jgi:hypothetical protein
MEKDLKKALETLNESKSVKANFFVKVIILKESCV